MSIISDANERAPLLAARTADVVEERSDLPHPAGDDRPRGGKFRREIFRLLRQSLPGSCHLFVLYGVVYPSSML